MRVRAVYLFGLSATGVDQHGLYSEFVLVYPGFFLLCPEIFFRYSPAIRGDMVDR